jgi:hypothetical protein
MIGPQLMPTNEAIDQITGNEEGDQNDYQNEENGGAVKEEEENNERGLKRKANEAGLGEIGDEEGEQPPTID